MQRTAHGVATWMVQGSSCRLYLLNLPSGDVKIAIENGPVIGDLPIKDGDFP